MQSIKNIQGVGRTATFPLKGTLVEFRNDLSLVGYPVDFEDPAEEGDEVGLTTLGGPIRNGDGEEAAVFVSAILEHEEQGQSVEREPRDLLDIIARHVRDGHVAVLDEFTFKRNMARRWAVDSKGERVSIDLVDLETQIVEHLDCSAGIPDLD